jgi:hypothetical protein
MAFKDYGEDGVAAIGPDGKKYIYAAADLEQTNSMLKAAHEPAKPVKPSKHSSRPTTKPGGPAPIKTRSRARGGASRSTRTGAGKPAKRAASKTSSVGEVEAKA